MYTVMLIPSQCTCPPNVHNQISVVCASMTLLSANQSSKVNYDMCFTLTSDLALSEMSVLLQAGSVDRGKL